MTGKKLIIDADPGIGDAIAIALALRDPTLDVLALTATGGTVTGEQAFRNLQTVVSMLDPPRWPRIGWSTAPRGATLDRPDRSGILLQDRSNGLGDCETFEAVPHAPTDSARVLVDMVRQWPGQITILTLGPLTNIRLAMERSSEFLADLGALVCFGGTLHGRGNVTAAAEFNVFSDPESARLVLTSQATKTLVPLDTAAKFGLTFDQYDSLQVDEFSRFGQFLSKTIPFGLRESRNQLGREGVILPEVAALAAVTCPRLQERQSLQIDVEILGELTRGMTVFDRRGLARIQPNIDVISDLDAVGVRDYLTKLVRASDTPC